MMLKSTRSGPLALLTVVVLIVAACGSGGSAAPGASGPSASGPAGSLAAPRTWPAARLMWPVISPIERRRSQQS